MLIIIKPLINFSELAAGQMSRLLILHLVSFWVAGSTSLKVFSFEKTLEASGSLSVATLDSKTSEDLPPRFKDVKEEIRIQLLFPRFVLCWSHKQGAWDQRGVFHMYGVDDQPWLTIRFTQSCP